MAAKNALCRKPKTQQEKLWKELPQKLQNFLEPEKKIEICSVKVLAKCSYKDRMIHFYPVSSIELLLRAYSKALIAGTLQKNQQ